jgi:antitoxin MazE
MSSTVKLRRIGNSLGFILPREVVEQLKVAEGDVLHVVTDAEGARLTPFDPQFDAALEAFGRTRRKYRNALRALAK